MLPNSFVSVMSIRAHYQPLWYPQLVMTGGDKQLLPAEPWVRIPCHLLPMTAKFGGGGKAKSQCHRCDCAFQWLVVVCGLALALTRSWFSILGENELDKIEQATEIAIQQIHPSFEGRIEREREEKRDRISKPMMVCTTMTIKSLPFVTQKTWRWRFCRLALQACVLYILLFNFFRNLQGLSST